MINFDKLCSNLIPDGRVKVQVTDIKFKVNALGESSSDMVVTYTVVEGPYAKRIITDTIYEKAFSFRLKPFLVACKVDTGREFETKEELYKFGLASAKGKILYLNLGTRTYGGKEYQEVKDFIPLEESTTSEDDVLVAFGTNPEAKGDALETVAPATEEPKVALADEPSLDLDGIELKDDDLPF